MNKLYSKFELTLFKRLKIYTSGMEILRIFVLLGNINILKQCRLHTLKSQENSFISLYVFAIDMPIVLFFR